MDLILHPLSGIPLIQKGDDVTELIMKALVINKIELLGGDILVITQKIISKSEGRKVYLSNIQVSERAREIAKISTKDPRLIELILRESNEILRITPDHIIVVHRLGFVCANAGIDHSNVDAEKGPKKDAYLLLPLDPDLSASQIREKVKIRTGRSVGILIIDSHGRAWRNGIMGTTIGIAGLPAIVDLRGKKDLFGYRLKITQEAAADELAAAASLLMGQADEKIPVVHIRGFPYEMRESTTRELIRAKEKDLFR